MVGSSAVVVCAAVVPLLCLALVTDGIPSPARWSPAAWTALLYLAVAASVVAFWLNYWLLARMDASAMLMMGVAEVPIAVLLGAAVLKERLPAGTFVGGTCVLIAVVTGLLGQRAQTVTATTRAPHAHSAERTTEP